MKKYLKRRSNAPGNDYTIPKAKSDEIIKQYNPELFDKNKWIRFKTTGEGQGIESTYGYYIDDNEEIHICYIEQHAFQTPGKQNKNTQYCNLFLDCEVDEKGNAISDINVKSGADIFPFAAKMALEHEYDLSSDYKTILNGRILQDTLDAIEKIKGDK